MEIKGGGGGEGEGDLYGKFVDFGGIGVSIVLKV
jgi:hypothetical protein